MSSENDKAESGVPKEEAKQEKEVFKEPEVPKQAVEKEQEAKLRAKYPGLRGPGSNPLLQKRLSKGQKYFDSGDYNMAKGKNKSMAPGQRLLLGSGATAHPTPDSVPTRKTSLIPNPSHGATTQPQGNLA